MSLRILVVGASGFVGQGLCAELTRRGYPTRGTYRSSANMAKLAADVEPVLIVSVDGTTDWSEALREMDVVVNLAARVHMMEDAAIDPLAEYRRVNVQGTLHMARQAAAAGVKRFVFLSSIKVNGEFTEVGRPFTATDTPAPGDPYGISKHEAEQLLSQIASETGMEVVNIRPPLVYGPGVKANFASMLGWLARGIPLPLAAVTENRRSLVALDNLVDLIVTCLDHPAAANETFLVSDGEDLSMADLLKRTGVALGQPARLFYVPPALLKLGLTIVKKTGFYQRLCNSLQLDITKTRQLLGWNPPVSVDEGLRRAAERFPL